MNERSEPTTGEGQADDHEFLFFADLLALDLINTEKKVRGKPHDLLATPTDFARWWEAARDRYVEREAVRSTYNAWLDDQSMLDEVKRLRVALRDFFGALVDDVSPPSHAVAQLNTVLRGGHHVIEVTPSGATLPVYQTIDHASSILFPIALSAVTWLKSGNQHRLHRCANQRCVLLFYDTTKSATRRWCSIGCMDRARSAQRYQRTKQATPAVE